MTVDPRHSRGPYSAAEFLRDSALLLKRARRLASEAAYEATAERRARRRRRLFRKMGWGKP